MKRMLEASGVLALVLPASAALGCPFCAQDRGAGIFLIVALSLLPLLLAAGVWAHVRRIEERAG
jgi:hypothetical protein